MRYRITPHANEGDKHPFLGQTKSHTMVRIGFNIIWNHSFLQWRSWHWNVSTLLTKIHIYNMVIMNIFPQSTWNIKVTIKKAIIYLYKGIRCHISSYEPYCNRSLAPHFIRPTPVHLFSIFHFLQQKGASCVPFHTSETKF